MATPSLPILPAAPGDGLAIARINIAAWQAAYARVFDAERLAARWDNLELATARWAERIRLQQPPHRTLVAEHAQQIVGFADTGPSRDDGADQRQTGEVNLIYVLPERWGAGHRSGPDGRGAAVDAR